MSNLPADEVGKSIERPLQVTDTQEFPWDKLAVDIVGPLERTSEKNKYILSCQDNLSKYLIAVPLQTQRAEEIAQILVKFVPGRKHHFPSNLNFYFSRFRGE
jgi:hypothetical protein